MESDTKLNFKVSVITPVYNREKYIAKAINSVINQTYNNWEYILVDDGSTDDSLNIISEFARKDSRVRLIQRKREPKGASTCRNIGITESNGEYVIFLDSDDYLLDHCLSSRIKAFGENSHLDFIVFQMIVVKEGHHDKVLWNIDSNDSDLFRFLSFDFVWSVTSPIWKKEALVKLCGFDEALSCWQDIDLSLRAILNGHIYKKMFDLSPDCVNVIHNHDSISQKGSHSIKHLYSKENMIGNLLIPLTDLNKRVFLNVAVSHVGLEYFRKLYFVRGNAYLDKYVLKNVISKKKYYHLLAIGILMKLRMYYRLKSYLSNLSLFKPFFEEEWTYPTCFRKIKVDIDGKKGCNFDALS